MKAATKNVLIVMSASVFGLLLSMSATQDIRVDGAAFTNLASAGNGADLVGSVDWSKVKMEPAVTTF